MDANSLVDEMWKLLDFTPDWWFKLGERLRTRVIESANSGDLPLGRSAYRDARYVKLKASGMRRAKNKPKIGKYAGRRTNTYTSSVNMNLTGDMWAGFHPESATDRSVRMMFKPEDSNKIEGNIGFDPIRDVANLSEENSQFILNEILDKIEKNMEDYCREETKITIRVGR